MTRPPSLAGEADDVRLLVAVTAIGGFIGADGEPDEAAPDDGDPEGGEAYRVTTVTADYYFTTGPAEVREEAPE